MSEPTGWQIRRIVCATDLSAGGDRALARSLLLAHEFDAALDLLHVVPSDLWADLSKRLAEALGNQVPSEETLRREALAALEALSRRTPERPGRKGEIAVLSGRPAAEITRYAEDTGADLIVVGAHGEHPVRDLMLGTTVQKLLRTSPCPVLIVKRPPPFAYKTILLPTDLSEPARQALADAVRCFPAATLHLGHAFELPYDGQLRYASVEDDKIEQHRAAARERLMLELRDWADAAGIPSARRALHVEHGYATSRISEWIDRLRADLVVLPARGKSTVEATFLGSVSLHMALAAPCDVLLMRHAGRSSERH